MLLKLIKNQILFSYRSLNKTEKEFILPLRLIMNIIFITYFIVLGFQLKTIINAITPDINPILMLNSKLFVFFQFDLLIRLLFFKIPQVDIIPYFTLPIKRRDLSWLFLLKSFYNLFNLFWILVIIPYAYSIAIGYSIQNVFIYLFIIILFLLINNLIFVLIKIPSNFKIYNIFILFSFITVLLSLLYKKELGVCDYSSAFFNDILNGHSYLTFYVLTFFIVPVLIFIDFKLVKKNIYQLHNSKSSIVFQNLINTYFISKWTIKKEIIWYIILEFKLLFRNKRPRSTLLISLYILLIGFFVLIKASSPDKMFVLFFTLISSNVIAMIYGQFIISWEGNYFDFIMSKPIDFNKYLRAKYYFFILCSFNITTLILLPFFIYLKMDMSTLFSLAIYNAGVNNFIIIYSSIFNSKKIDLSLGAMANNQGVKIHQYIAMILIVIIPLMMFLFIENELVLIFTWTLAGFIFIFLHKKWIKCISNILLKRKYINIENFKN